MKFVAFAVLVALFSIGLPSSLPFAQQASPPALASDPLSRTLMPFDARILTDQEKRLLQAGLAAAGHYVGVIDGAWGRRSQQALEDYGRSIDEEWAQEALFWHALALTEWVQELLDASELSYRTFSPYGLRMIAPPGALAFDDDVPSIGRLRGPGFTIVLARQTDAVVAQFHDDVLRRHAMRAPPYTLRRDARLVTSSQTSRSRYYARSERVGPGGVWSSALIMQDKGELDGLFTMVVASIAPESNAHLGLTPGSPFETSYRELAAFSAGLDAEERPSARREPPRGKPDAVSAPSDPEGGDVTGTGTAFYVNNFDLVTAAHVVEDCRKVTLGGGEELRIAAIHPDLDLALLTGDRRSRAWLSVDQTGEGRLGQKVYALGYPYFGITTTSLNVTAGNVSATKGLADRESELTISAPVQPGNSGGPLLDSQGSIIGIVIAKLSASAMLEAASSLPENVNFAVRGAELIEFLDDEGVLYPKSGDAGFDVEDGIPQRIQDAIVPVFCG